MNVYDFDNTIYDGESVFDFYFYSVRKQPELIQYAFVVIKTLIKYKLCRITEDELFRLAQKYAQHYLAQVRDLDGLIKSFWDKNQHKIKPFYLKQMREDDVIVSASVDCLLQEIINRIGVRHAICTKFDRKAGKLEYVCYRKNKVSLFYEQFPDGVIENFYTDSKNDLALMELAERTFMVRGNHITLFRDKKR